MEAQSEGRNRGKRLISPSEGEYFLNKVWNALLCFIICSLNLIFTFTNGAKRKRRKEESAQEPWKHVRPRRKRRNGLRGAVKVREERVAGGEQQNARLRINCCTLGGHIPSLGIMQRWSQISDVFIPQLSTRERLWRVLAPLATLLSPSFLCRM